MQEYQEQVVRDHKELAEKCNKIHQTLETPEFLEFGECTQTLLRMQYSTMHVYLRILNRLIAEFNKEQ